MAAFIFTKIKKLMSYIAKKFKSSAWALGRGCCPKRIEKLQKALELRAEKKRNKKLEQSIRAKIENMWMQYDRDNNGYLDIEETKEFVKDLLL